MHHRYGARSAANCLPGSRCRSLYHRGCPRSLPIPSPAFSMPLGTAVNVADDTKLRVRMMPPQHLGRYHADAEALGRNLPCAIVIGAPPGLMFSAASKVPYESTSSKWPARGKERLCELDACKTVPIACSRGCGDRHRRRGNCRRARGRRAVRRIHRRTFRSCAIMCSERRQSRTGGIRSITGFSPAVPRTSTWLACRCRPRSIKGSRPSCRKSSTSLPLVTSSAASSRSTRTTRTSRRSAPRRDGGLQLDEDRGRGR